MVSQSVKDLTSGTAGGVCQVLIGQPFDLIKVRMQTAPPGTYKGMVDAFTGVIKNEGPLAFYKGTLTPLLGVGACVSIQFAALNATKRHFARQNGSDELKYHQLFIAGAAAGLSNSIVSGPVEHIRIRLQTQPSNPRLYNGPVDCVSKIYSQHGMKGIFKGQVPTLWREASGYGAYFMAYEALVQRHVRVNNIARADMSPGYAVWYGALAGYALWAVIYPIDVVKSRFQTDGFTSTTQKYTSVAQCFKTTWATEGLAGFTRGLGPTLIRSPFANGFTFLGAELMMRALNGGSDTPSHDVDADPPA